MKNKRSLIAWSGLALLVLLVALAILQQSAHLLYIASLLPVVIVPFLPDIRSNMRVKPGKRSGFDMYLLKQQGASSPDFVVLEFEPYLMNWSKKRLYFQISENRMPVFTELKENNAVSLSVLPYDLTVGSLRTGWFGLDLGLLRQRASGFSFTHEEVGRFVIRLDDLRAAARGTSAPPPAASNKGLQA